MIKRPDTNAQRLKRHKRVRAKLSGTPERPRLNVFRSEKNIYAQVIDDVAGNTLVSASSLDKEIEGNGGNKTAARAVGKLVAERCKAKGIETVVFDRGGYVYHGRVAELAEGATILVTNRKVLICAIIRIINNLLLYGFPVIMPLYLCTTHNGGINIFKTEEWMRIWGFVFVITLIFNTFWGWFMDRFGWVWPMRWFGCAVLAVGSVAFYYIPQWFGANAIMMIVASVIVGIGTCAFSSLPTIMTLYAGGKQGAALSAYNLAAGLTTFAGPGIATILLPIVGYEGVCWTYAGLYVLAFVLTLFIRPQQPGFDAKGHRIKGAKVASAESSESSEPTDSASVHV